MKKILVTGSSGFIGSNLVIKLNEAGLDVYNGVRSLDDSINEKDVECDLTDLNGILNMIDSFRFDTIIHLAALVGWSGQSYQEMFLENVLSTGALAYVSHKMEAKFIFASAALVHGKNTEVITKESPIELDTNYARSKYDAEVLLRSILPEACIFRIGGVFGCNGPNHLGINKSISEALKGYAPVLVGSGKSKRNYIYIDDLVEILLLAIKRKSKGTYLIAGNESLSIKDMLNQVCNELLPGKNIQTNNVSINSHDQVINTTSQFVKTRTFKEALIDIQKKALIK